MDGRASGRARNLEKGKMVILSCFRKGLLARVHCEFDQEHGCLKGILEKVKLT